jgi:hypothetical protein
MISIENRYTLKCTIAEISWLPHSQSIKDCLYLIKFVLRCLYIEDDNRFMFLTEIQNVGKPDVEIDE